jgi:hypothetical protein
VSWHGFLSSVMHLFLMMHVSYLALCTRDLEDVLYVCEHAHRFYDAWQAAFGMLPFSAGCPAPLFVKSG